jgi:hypothetical protein
MSDPTADQPADVVRFWTHRFDQVDLGIKLINQQLRQLTEVTASLAGESEARREPPHGD